MHICVHIEFKFVSQTSIHVCVFVFVKREKFLSKGRDICISFNSRVLRIVHVCVCLFQVSEHKNAHVFFLLGW